MLQRLILCLGLLVLTGCEAVNGDPNGDPIVGNNGPVADDDDDDSQLPEPELHEDVVLVEDDDCFVTVDVPEDREILTFEFSCDPVGRGIDPGSIVVGVTNGGYLRRVESVAIDGYVLTAYTIEASIAEALDEGSLSQQVISLNSEERTLIDLGNTSLYSGEIGGSDVSVMLNTANIDIDPVFNVDGHWADGEVQNFSMDFGLGLRGEISGTLASSNGLRFGDSVDLYSTSTPFAFAVGPLPVAGLMTVKIKAGWSLNSPGQVSVRTGTSGTLEFRNRSVYVNPDGWSDDDVADINWVFDTPELQVSTEAKARLYLRLDTSVDLYGVTGPLLSNDVFVQASTEPTCDGITWDVRGGLSSKLKVHLNILDKFKPTKTFAQANFTADIASGMLDWPIGGVAPCGHDPIDCGDTVTGDTSSAALAQMDAYSCNVGNYEAPEMVWAWRATASETATWQLIDPEPTTVNHDVMVVDGAWNLVTAECFTWGSNSIEFEAEAGQVYYLVVDGYDQDAGAFIANLECDTQSPAGEDDDPLGGTINPF